MDDYPQTDASVRMAYEAMLRERENSGLPKDYFDAREQPVFDRDRMNDKLEFARIVERYGAKAVQTWLINLAKMLHQEL